MSLDVDGFTSRLDGGEVVIKVDTNHRLLKLARQLPWDEMLNAVGQGQALSFAFEHLFYNFL